MSNLSLEESAKECLESCIKDFEELAQESEDTESMIPIFRETMENSFNVEELVKLYSDTGDYNDIEAAIHEHITGECTKFSALLYGAATEKLTHEIETYMNSKKKRSVRKPKHRFSGSSSMIQMRKSEKNDGKELRELPAEYLPKLMSAEEFIASGGMDKELSVLSENEDHSDSNEDSDEDNDLNDDPEHGMYDPDDLPDKSDLKPLDMSDLAERFSTLMTQTRE